MKKTTIRTLGLYTMILLYFAAGVNHFINPEFYEKVMPSYIPFHEACIILSGICEIAFAILLIPNATRQLAAWLIVAMLIVFFIIHVQTIVTRWETNGLPFWIPIFRFPLQFVLIWWAYIYTKNNDKKPQPIG